MFVFKNTVMTISDSKKCTALKIFYDILQFLQTMNP